MEEIVSFFSWSGGREEACILHCSCSGVSYVSSYISITWLVVWTLK